MFSPPSCNITFIHIIYTMTKTLKNPIIKPNNPPLPKKKVVKAKKKRERKKDGRKLLFKTKEALQKEIDEYFESCYEMQWKDRDWRDEKGNRVKEGDTWKKEPYQVKVMIQVPTISGLAVALDTSRQTLINYEEREEFFDTIKRAKQFIESIVEE